MLSCVAIINLETPSIDTIWHEFLINIANTNSTFCLIEQLHPLTFKPDEWLKWVGHFHFYETKQLFTKLLLLGRDLQVEKAKNLNCIIQYIAILCLLQHRNNILKWLFWLYHIMASPEIPNPDLVTMNIILHNFIIFWPLIIILFAYSFIKHSL